MERQHCACPPILGVGGQDIPSGAAMLQGYKLAARGLGVERGPTALIQGTQGTRENARRRPPGWGASLRRRRAGRGPVVVRGGESPPQGEGVQVRLSSK